MRITITTAPLRKKPKSGDKKIIKGVTYVRRHRRGGFCNGLMMSGGRPVYEWVIDEHVTKP